MDNNDESNEIEKLVSQFKKLNDVTSQKQSLEYTLEQLTFCNNIAALSKKEIFHLKVLMPSAKIICNSTGPHSGAIQTLVISIENISDAFTFDCNCWQFQIGLNDRTQGAWILENPLSPGSSDTFRVPLTDQNFQFPFIKVSIFLHFTIEFESKTYAKSFEVLDCSLDMLDYLDPEKYIMDTSIHESLRKPNFVDISDELHNSKVEFPPLTKFILRLDPPLKDRFLRDVLLNDSLHRGFEDCIDELCTKSEISVYYLGIQIDVNLSKSDIVVITCTNPHVLSALKALILGRLATVDGIFVEALDEKNRELLDNLDLKLQTLSLDDPYRRNRISQDDLMELYLELRDISESIRFSLVHSVE